MPLFPIATSTEQKVNFAIDLQDRLGILALSTPFRICKLHIPLAGRAISLERERLSKNENGDDQIFLYRAKTGRACYCGVSSR